MHYVNKSIGKHLSVQYNSQNNTMCNIQNTDTKYQHRLYFPIAQAPYIGLLLEYGKSMRTVMQPRSHIFLLSLTTWQMSSPSSVALEQPDIVIHQTVRCNLFWWSWSMTEHRFKILKHVWNDSLIGYIERSRFAQEGRNTLTGFIKPIRVFSVEFVVLLLWKRWYTSMNVWDMTSEIWDFSLANKCSPDYKCKYFWR